MNADPRERDFAEDRTRPQDPADERRSDPVEPGGDDKDVRHRDERLRDLVDGIEQDVADERRDEDIPGNVEERKRTPSVEPDDQAPD